MLLIAMTKLVVVWGKAFLEEAQKVNNLLKDLVMILTIRGMMQSLNR